MAHRQAIVRQVVALLAGIVASCSCALAATDWVVRPIVADAEGVIYNADVMVSPAGEIAVGYAISPGYPSGGTVTLARLRGRIFEYRDFSLDGMAPSFAMDGAGGVYYASNLDSNSAATTLGHDLGMWGGMHDDIIVDSCPRPSAPSLALDHQGVPAVAGNYAEDGMVYSRFDIPSGRWQTQTIGPPGLQQANRQSLCFNAENRAAVGYVNYTGLEASPATLIVAREGSFAWGIAEVAGDAIAPGGVSIAAGAGGSVAFAFISPNGLMFGTNDGAYTNVEMVDSAGVGLMSHSLAYDAAGNPGIVCGTGSGLRLWRRDQTGLWDQELLPIPDTGDMRGNLAFAGDGEPYVLAVGRDNITLLGSTLPELIPGDTNGDGDVDAIDLANLVAQFGGPPGADSADFNGDIFVDLEDFAIMRGNYGFRVPTLPDAGPVATTPEPATLSLLALLALSLPKRGGLAMLRRRR